MIADAVVGRVRRVVGDGALVDEAHEPGVLEAVGLHRAGRGEDALVEAGRRREPGGVAARRPLGQPRRRADDVATRVLLGLQLVEAFVSWAVVNRGPRPSSTQRTDSPSTSVGEAGEHARRRASTSSTAPTVVYGPRGSIAHLAVGVRRRPSGSRSSTGGPRRSGGRSARRAARPACQPALVGAGTALGLHTAAASTATSWVNVAPSSSRRCSDSSMSGREPVGEALGVLLEHRQQVAVARVEALDDVVERGGHLGVAQPEHAGDDARRPPARTDRRGRARARTAGRRRAPRRARSSHRAAGDERRQRSRDRGRRAGVLQRRDQRQRRLGTLVEVDAVGLEAVEAGAALGIAHRHADVVDAEEPVDARASRPSRHASSPVTAYARAQASAIAAASIGCWSNIGGTIGRAGATDAGRRQVTVDRLAVEQPAQRGEPVGEHLGTVERRRRRRSAPRRARRWRSASRSSGHAHAASRRRVDRWRRRRRPAAVVRRCGPGARRGPRPRRARRRPSPAATANAARGRAGTRTRPPGASTS